MSSRWIRCALVCIMPLGNVAFAQPAVVSISAPSALGERPDEEPTLPPVIVKPEETPAITTGGEPAPNMPSGPVPSRPFDLPWSYPDLSQVEFKGLGSSLRSTGSVFDTPHAVSVVRLQELRERNARDMVEAIEREVGVLVQRTGRGQASPFIRGLTGPQTLILVDGIRMNNSTFRLGPNQYFALVDPGTIERIEIVRGPQSVLWGSDAIGGVINVVTRGADMDMFSYETGEFIERFSTADSGSYSRVSVEGSRSGSLGIFGGASYLNAINLDRGGGLGRQQFTDFSQYAGDVKLNYLIDDRQFLTVALQHFQQLDVPRSDKWPGEARRFDPQLRDLGYIRWQGQDLGGVFDAFMLTASFQRQEENTIRRKPPTSLLVDHGFFDVETSGLNFVLSSDFGVIGDLTYGVDFYHDEVDSQKTRYDDSAAAAPRPLTPQFPDDSHYERLGLFLQWDVDLTSRLAALAGVRYSNIESGATVALFDPNDPQAPPVDTPIDPAFNDWTASVGLSYEVTPCLHLVGSVAEGFRAPSLDDLTSVSDNVNEGIDIPNPNLSPETSINYEVGLKFNFDRVRAQTFVFWTDLKDLLDRQAVGVVPDPLVPGSFLDVLQRRNVGSAQLQGYELAGELLLTATWSCFGNFTYIYGQNLSNNEPMSRIPPTQGILGLRWRDREARNWLELYGWLVARQDRLSARDIRDSRIPADGTPGYGTVNLRLGRSLGTNHRVTLGIENIFDELYRVHGSGVDGPGISGVFGYELQL